MTITDPLMLFLNRVYRLESQRRKTVTRFQAQAGPSQMYIVQVFKGRRFSHNTRTPGLPFHFVVLAGVCFWVSDSRFARQTTMFKKFFEFTSKFLGLDFTNLGYTGPTSMNKLQCHENFFRQEHLWNVLMVGKQWGFNLENILIETDRRHDSALRVLLKEEYFLPYGQATLANVISAMKPYQANKLTTGRKELAFTPQDNITLMFDNSFWQPSYLRVPFHGATAPTDHTIQAAIHSFLTPYQAAAVFAQIVDHGQQFIACKLLLCSHLIHQSICSHSTLLILNRISRRIWQRPDISAAC